jgi:uncharacterized protein YjbJ (UPF0337 family)
MTGERTKGSINKVAGKAQEGFGKLTGNQSQQAKGKAKQIKGSVQQGVGNVQDAARPR